MILLDSKGAGAAPGEDFEAPAELGASEEIPMEEEPKKEKKGKAAEVNPDDEIPF